MRLHAPQLQKNFIAQVFGSGLVAGPLHGLRQDLSHAQLVGAVNAVGHVLADIRRLGATEFVVQVLLERLFCLVATAVSHCLLLSFLAGLCPARVHNRQVARAKVVGLGAGDS